MHFEPNTIYHIYNQGNNRQRIFFEVKNYLFFLQKMRTHLLPYGDLLCYCLMPNHFHWLLFVREVEVGVSAASASAGATQSRPGTFDAPRLRSLNDSIGILLSSYTRAINKQETRTGALFREETKAKDGWEDPYLSPAHPRYQQLQREWDLYGTTCFHYIHENPKRAGIVTDEKDWPYSSCQDYAGLRKGTLCNQSLAKELLCLP